MKTKYPSLLLRWKYIIICVILFPHIIVAQELVPLNNNPAILASYQQILEQRFKSSVSEVKGINSKYILEEYQKRYDYLKKMYEKKLLVTDTLANNYFNKIKNRIIESNPILQQLKPAVYFSRAWWPNATSYGEGTILFNISLFNRLDNESQLAFILCHELSHYYLNHSNAAIESYINTIHSEAFQAELKEIKNTEFFKNKRADELLKNISYTQRRHSRNKESEADSLALELLRGTGFDTRESIKGLALLDSVDEEKYTGSLQLKEQFNFPEYPFKARWTKAPSLSLGEAMSSATKDGLINEDSLKTHPDCNKRIAALNTRANDYYQPAQQLFQVNKDLFLHLSNRFDIERIEYCVEAEETGKALYLALQLFSQQPRNVFLATTIGKCLNQVFKAQKEHTLGRIIEAPGRTNNKEYEDYLRFLQNLTLSDIASISHFFMQKLKPVFGSDKNYISVMEISQTNFNSINQ